jgi:CheY-like chemotaxis protein
MAEDEEDIALQYKMVLENRGHVVTVTNDGEACVQEYKNSLEKSESGTKSSFDVVILDIRMPKKTGLDAGKEIIDLNPLQRIIFCSAYVKEDFADLIKDYDSARVIGVLQKPFKLSVLTAAVEDKEMYEKLENFYSSIEKNNEIDPKDPDIKNQLDTLNENRNPDLWYSVKHIMIG